MNEYLILVLRITHILAGVLWVGSAITYFTFIEPVVAMLGPAKSTFMQHFIERKRYPLYMNIVSALTILAGALLYWNTSGRLQGVWIKTGPGLGFTIGAVVALIVYLIAFFLIRPRADRLGAIVKQIALSGGPSTPEQAAELNKTENEMRAIERVEVVLLTLSLILMATARYW